MDYEYVLGMDPGEKQSGWAFILADGKMVDCGVEPNEAILERTIPRIDKTFGPATVMAMEYMEVRGQKQFPAEARRSLWWAGRFRQAWLNWYVEIPPSWVHRAMCGYVSVDKRTLREAIFERYPGTGGGKTPVIGTKKEKGPLYGITNHAISALGVALTWIDDGPLVAKKQENLT